MEKNNMLNATQVSLLVETTVPTLNMWYRWKRLNPEHEMAKLLPTYTTIGSKKTRYWTTDDVEKLIKFKNTIPKGRNGILGEVTQKYVKKKEKNYESK